MPTRRTSLLAAASLLFAPLVEARRGGGGRRASFSGRGMPHGASYSGPVLSREELQRCVTEQRTINSLSEKVDQEQAALDDEESNLRKLSRRIENERAFVNSYSQQSVDSFNRLVNEHRKKVDAFNRRLPAVNEKVTRLNSSIESFNGQCAQRAYYQSDMDAVLAGKLK